MRIQVSTSNRNIFVLSLVRAAFRGRGIKRGGIMLKSERQKNICRRYSARDKDGYVHCNDCPLVVDRKYHMCRSNSHYDRQLKEWVPDEVRDK